MDFIKNNIKTPFLYIKALIKWSVIAIVLGILGGTVGSVFHIAIDFVTEKRMQHFPVIYFLPVGAILIALLYNLFKKSGKIDTNRVLDSARGGEKIPIIMLPLIFVSTIITHFFGGSAGREGAALQIGGSIGYSVGKLFRFDKNNSKIIVMAGMSSVFAALFGTPITAAIFALEVINVGVFHYMALLPCVISAVVASRVAVLFSISPVRFSLCYIPLFDFVTLLKVVAVSFLAALVSILFCNAIKKCEQRMDKMFASVYKRALAGSVIVLALTLFCRTTDYNGAGMHVITRAIEGNAAPWDFILKIIFTAISISAGFKGGEIVPAFFVGSTFGCTAATLFGLDPSFGAAIGFVVLFCSVVNCPVASLILSIEVFGSEGILYFAVACAISYLISGNSGLYKSQVIVYSKLTDEYQGIE